MRMILDDRQETSTGTTMGSNSASEIILKHVVSGKNASGLTTG